MKLYNATAAKRFPETNDIGRAAWVGKNKDGGFMQSTIYTTKSTAEVLNEEDVARLEAEFSGRYEIKLYEYGV